MCVSVDEQDLDFAEYEREESQRMEDQEMLRLYYADKALIRC